MKQWMKEHKWTLLISSVMILVPILFGLLIWEELPDSMNTHWGADGNADGSMGKAFAVLVPSLIILAVHWLCILATAWDMKKNPQGKKAIRVVLWIMPVVSLFANAAIYTNALGKPFLGIQTMPLLLGLGMAAMGNVLPKFARNRTMGIKLKWTLQNDENWDKTHRLGGKVWFACGLIMMLAVFLPVSAILWVLALAVIAMIGIPTGYSYWLYKQHQKAGIAYDFKSRSKKETIAVRVSAVIGILILLGASVCMVTGDIQYHCEDTALQIEADFWQDLTVDYDAIDRVEYREDWEMGYRANGWGSLRLSMGNFQNEEAGNYSLYSYTNAKAWVVVEADGKILALSAEDAAQTRALYEELLEKVGD